MNSEPFEPVYRSIAYTDGREAALKKQIPLDAVSSIRGIFYQVKRAIITRSMKRTEDLSFPRPCTGQG
jgi:hypothetical protein